MGWAVDKKRRRWIGVVEEADGRVLRIG